MIFFYKFFNLVEINSDCFCYNKLLENGKKIKILVAGHLIKILNFKKELFFIKNYYSVKNNIKSKQAIFLGSNMIEDTAVIFVQSKVIYIIKNLVNIKKCYFTL